MRGLARAVEAHGAVIYERTPVVTIEPHHVVTTMGIVGADVVVRATEGYTPTLAGHRRTVAPVYSLMIATAPLPDSFWNDTGLARARNLRRPSAPDHLRPAHRR